MRSLKGPAVSIDIDQVPEVNLWLAARFGVGEDALDSIEGISPIFLNQQYVLARCVFSGVTPTGEHLEPQAIPLLLRWTEVDYEVVKHDRLGTSGLSQELLLEEEEQLLDWVRFYFGMEIGLGQRLIEAEDDLTWFTPLLDEERRMLQESLEAHPLRLTETNDEFFVVECNLFLGGTLYKEKLQIGRGTAQTYFLNESSLEHQKGFLRLAGHSIELINGLPDNHLLAPGHWASRLHRDTKLESSDWLVVNESKEPILNDINRNLGRALPVNSCVLSKKYLPFYRQYLYRIDVEEGGEVKTGHAIWSPGELHVINYDKHTIQELNKVYRGVLPMTLNLESNARHYVQFINDFFWSDDGPSLIVENRDHPRFAEVSLDRAVLPEGKTLEEALSRLSPVKVLREDDACFLDFCIWEGFSIFHVTLKVEPNGSVHTVLGEQVIGFEKPATAKLIPFERLRLQPHALGRQSGRQLQTVQAEALVASLDLSRDATGNLHAYAIDLTSQAVCGNFSLKGVVLQSGLHLDGCRFRGLVDLSGLRSDGGITISHCIFEGGLKLDQAQVGHSVSITYSVMVGNGFDSFSLSMEGLHAQSLKLQRVTTQHGVSAHDMRFTGSVKLIDTSIYGLLLMRYCQIDGELFIQSARETVHIASDLDLSHLRAKAVEVQGLTVNRCLNMSGALIQQHLIFGKSQLKANPTTIGNSLESAEIALNLHGVTIQHNHLTCLGIEVGGEIEASFLTVGTGLFLHEACQIAGDVELSGCTIPQVLRILGGNIRRLRITGSEIGSLMLRAESNDFSIIPLNVEQGIELSDSTIKHNALVAGVACVDSGRPCLIADSAHIGGSLYLVLDPWEQVGTATDLPIHLAEGLLGCTFPSGVDLRRTQVNGDIDLSCLNASKGQIDLESGKVGGDIRFALSPDNPRTRCRKLVLSGLSCDGDVSLSGLALHDERKKPRDIQTASIVAIHSQVTGSFKVYENDEAASIPGCLNLRDSELGSLSISYQFFDGPCDFETLDKHGIILNRTTIGKLSVRVDQGFPRPIDLRFSNIQWWEFLRADRAESENADDYIRLLEQDPAGQRQTWHAIENSLHERGYEDAADEVHRAMRRWETRKARKEARNRSFPSQLALYSWLAIRWPFDFLTGFGTDVTRLAVLLLIWLSVSTYLFSINSNMTPSEEGLAATNTALNAQSRPDQWGIGDGFWVALRYHVPVVAFTARDDWEPAGDADLVIRQPDSEQALSTSWLDPEQYANLVVIFHWLAWPIILFTASRKILRRSSS